MGNSGEAIRVMPFPGVAGRIVRGLRWIVRSARMIIKAPKVSVFSKVVLLLVYLGFHIFKADLAALRVFVNVNGVKYRLVSYDTLGILAYLEPWMDKYLRVRNGDVFVDVGAHVGKYALRVAKRNPASLVVAIEPGSLQFSALVDGIRKIRKIRNVIPLRVAAWDDTARLRLRVYSDTGTSSIIEGLGTGRLIGEEEVRARPLDDVIEELGLRRVDWVKIDVEGAELHVLRGFKNGILRFKPKIVIEVKKFNREDVLRFFEEVGYACRNIPEDESGEYFICVPKS
jgi:FkbM family methyltransferase